MISSAAGPREWRHDATTTTSPRAHPAPTARRPMILIPAQPPPPCSPPSSAAPSLSASWRVRSILHLSHVSAAAPQPGLQLLEGPPCVQHVTQLLEGVPPTQVDLQTHVLRPCQENGAELPARPGRLRRAAFHAILPHCTAHLMSRGRRVLPLQGRGPSPSRWKTPVKCFTASPGLFQILSSNVSYSPFFSVCSLPCSGMNTAHLSV
mmetsp:Transcript_7096/g.25014  ORF Transcript_7096/g.25014 Transcript_7096/m.25014 type:complete len:207 (+) Transcript_7096:41-661(+)